MPHGITLRDLKYARRLRDGDVIRGKLTENDIPEDSAIQFNLGSGVNWWKAVKAVNENDAEIWTVELQDGNRNSEDFFLTEDDIEAGARLEFWKAKWGGTRWHLYTLEDLSVLKGKRVALTWSAD